MKEINNLQVRYHNKIVGTLAETIDGQVAFQYDKQWLEEGFSISPFSLPLEERVFVPKGENFEGLYGVFADSLPDGWGRLLVDRMLLTQGYNPAEIKSIVRLGIVGSTGMGALEYYPEFIKGEPEKEPWIVKFPSSYDSPRIGEEEYAYMKCAKKCGIDVPEVKLFASKINSGYFGVKRFDRVKKEKIHMITVSGLLETSHRIPNLDYSDLMKLTYMLTKDSRQVEEMYRRMCFNVFAHNRDDHSKNFSFQYNEEEKQWTLTPAYDLTYSNSLGGEHATCVNGNGRNPGIEEVLAVGEKAGISKKRAESLAKDIKEIVNEELSSILKRY